MNDDDRKLMQFHDQELDGTVQAEVAARIATDAAARAELARLHVVRELVRGAHEARLGSVDFADAIVRRVVAGSPAPRIARARRPRWERFAPASAVLALAAVVYLFIASSRETTAPEARRIVAAPAVSLEATAAGLPKREEPLAEPQEAGVSIQTVDFGSTQGAIFQVSAGERETMVVWTLEDASDKG